IAAMQGFIRRCAFVSLSGLAACDSDGEDAFEQPTEAAEFRGLVAYNGLEVGNGLIYSNGLALDNGVILSNGLAAANGLSVITGLVTSTGLSPNFGYITTTSGRKFLRYLIECALPANDALIKGGHIFVGRIGLAPEWKHGSCGQECQEWVSA